MWKNKIRSALVLVLCAALNLTFGPGAVAEEALSAAERDELQLQLDEARRQLDEAAARLGELHGKLYAMETVGHHGKKPMLGVLLGHRGDGGGLELSGVTPGGGAEAAGIMAGDEITSINGVDLTGAESALAVLKDTMRDVEPGDSVAVGYRRDGGDAVAAVTTQPRGVYIMGMTGVPNVDMDIEIDVEGLELMADELAAKFSDVDFSSEWVESLESLGNLESLESLQSLESLESLGALGSEVGHAVTRAIRIGGGLRLEDVEADLARYFGVDSGVLVMSVPEGDEGFSVLKPGDVILSVGDESIENAHSAYRALFDTEEPVTVEVIREGANQVVEVTPNHTRPKSITIRSGSVEDIDVRVIAPEDS